MFQNYGNPTCVTRSKFAPNLADPTSMRHSISTLNRQEIKFVAHTDNEHFERMFKNMDYQRNRGILMKCDTSNVGKL